MDIMYNESLNYFNGQRMFYDCAYQNQMEFHRNQIHMSRPYCDNINQNQFILTHNYHMDLNVMVTPNSMALESESNDWIKNYEYISNMNEPVPMTIKDFDNEMQQSLKRTTSCNIEGSESLHAIKGSDQLLLIIGYRLHNL